MNTIKVRCDLAYVERCSISYREDESFFYKSWITKKKRSWLVVYRGLRAMLLVQAKPDENYSRLMAKKRIVGNCKI